MPSAAEIVRATLKQRVRGGQKEETQSIPSGEQGVILNDRNGEIKLQRDGAVLRSSKVKRELQRLQREIPFETNLDDKGYVMSLEWEIEGVFKRMKGGINFQLPIHDEVIRGISIRGVAIGSNIVWPSFHPVGQFPYPELVSTVNGITLIANEDFLVINSFEKHGEPIKHMESMDPSIWLSRLHSREQLSQWIARHTLRTLEISS